MLTFTKRESIGYEDLIHVVASLANNDHVFYTVIEEMFTESMLDWQQTKNPMYQTRIIKLTEVITAVCGLNS